MKRTLPRSAVVAVRHGCNPLTIMAALAVLELVQDLPPVLSARHIVVIAALLAALREVSAQVTAADPGVDEDHTRSVEAVHRPSAFVLADRIEQRRHRVVMVVGERDDGDVRRSLQACQDRQAQPVGHLLSVVGLRIRGDGCRHHQVAEHCVERLYGFRP